MSRPSLFTTALAALVASASTADASDVSVFLPAGYLGSEVDEHLELLFAAQALPAGSLRWDPEQPGVRLTRARTGVIGVSANLRYQQVIAAGPLMFTATVPAALELEIGFGCQGVLYTVDARNVRITIAGGIFEGPAAQAIETAIEDLLTLQAAAMDESLIEVTTAYGLPMQSKCVAVNVEANAGLVYQFDLGCVEGHTRHETCPGGSTGRGIDFECVDREWSRTAVECSGPNFPH
jgi:hypothetical protein